MLESIIFGTLQGILEWLPISSQGNLVLVMMGIFGYSVKKALEFSIFLHLGTLLAVLIYFRKDIKEILLGLKSSKLEFRNNKEKKIISFLIISTIVTGLIGYPLFKILIVSTFKGEIFIGLVGVALIFTGILQKIAASKKKTLKTKQNLSFKDSLLLGLAQGLSIIPGISRSGITTSTFLFLGYKAEDALRLSFLMSIPAVLAAEIGLKIIEGMATINMANASIGLLFSFLFGILTIHFFLKIAKTVNFWLFCLILGAIALIPLVFYL